MNDYLKHLIQLKDLSQQESRLLCEALFESDNDSQQAAVLTLLQAKQETADELLGFLSFMKTQMIPVSYEGEAIDIVGTGGDGMNTLNLSTAAALLAASAGATVIKHGNRSSTSRCGSGNFIERCGIPLYAESTKVIDMIEQTRFGFCLANYYHPILKKCASLRRSLGVPTIFNLIAPLLNPADVPYLLCGVYSESLLPIVADVLAKQNIKHAFVVHGNGLDELNCLGENQVIEVVQGKTRKMIIDPKDYGFNYGVLSDLQGSSIDDNYEALITVLRGDCKGSLANTIALNAGAALYLSGITDTVALGVSDALSALQEGRAMTLLTRLAGDRECTVI